MATDYFKKINNEWIHGVQENGDIKWGDKGINDGEVRMKLSGYRYDENGDEKAFVKPENGSHKERTKEMIEWIEMVEHNHPLSFRGNEELMKIPFTYALEISFDEIKEKYLKDYLPMMRGIMRKDTMLIGYIAGEDIG